MQVLYSNCILRSTSDYVSPEWYVHVHWSQLKQTWWYLPVDREQCIAGPTYGVYHTVSPVEHLPGIHAFHYVSSCELIIV